MKIKLLGLVLSLLAIGYARADDFSLSLHVKGVKNNQGNVYVELYNEAKAFRKSAQAFAILKAPAKEGDITVKFDRLKLGHYAVLAYHDEDGNGLLNKRFGMIPTEGYGLSNDPSVIGPPSFEDSDFEILGDAEININMHY
jgi:uncharacterized protein (DUF2141 family)